MVYIYILLVGGLEHDFYDFSIQLGMSWSQLTKSIIFQRGRYTTNQKKIYLKFIDIINEHGIDVD